MAARVADEEQPPGEEAEVEWAEARQTREKVSHLMGQYLLKGYRMLGVNCSHCEVSPRDDREHMHVMKLGKETPVLSALATVASFCVCLRMRTILTTKGEQRVKISHLLADMVVLQYILLALDPEAWLRYRTLCISEKSPTESGKIYTLHDKTRKHICRNDVTRTSARQDIANFCHFLPFEGEDLTNVLLPCYL